MGILTSFFRYALVPLNVFVICIDENWTFFVKMLLKLEFVRFRSTQDTGQLALTKFLVKIIKQRFKLGTFVKIISNIFEVYVRQELQLVVSVYFQIWRKHSSWLSQLLKGFSSYVLEYDNAPILGLKVNAIMSYLFWFFNKSKIF